MNIEQIEQSEKVEEAGHWHAFSIDHRRNDSWSQRTRWLHRSWHVYDGHSHEIVDVELSMPGRVSFELRLNDEHPIAGHLGLGLFTLYCSLGWWAHKLPLSKWMRARYRYDAREISVGIDHEALCLRWSLWMRPHEWRHREPKWRRGSFYPLDALFGRQRYENHVLKRFEDVQIVIPGDPQSYVATVTLEQPVWTRKRWPWWPLKVVKRTADIELLAPIPIPGKGENAWDCDDDATYSMSCPAETVEEAVAQLVASVQRSRERYGGKRWRPRAAIEATDTDNQDGQEEETEA